MSKRFKSSLFFLELLPRFFFFSRGYGGLCTRSPDDPGRPSGSSDLNLYNLKHLGPAPGQTEVDLSADDHHTKEYAIKCLKTSPKLQFSSSVSETDGVISIVGCKMAQEIDMKVGPKSIPHVSITGLNQHGFN